MLTRACFGSDYYSNFPRKGNNKQPCSQPRHALFTALPMGGEAPKAASPRKNADLWIGCIRRIRSLFTPTVYMQAAGNYRTYTVKVSYG